ncbi:TPA: hypothetical protein MB363_003583 [Klebsiella quasipneumoniae subsp. similipneumoniae]|nr:hypothetical protein [Klebsiella quasipneumoniae subsp. similipneumoniae]
MLKERELSWLVLKGLKLTEKKLEKHFRGKSFLYLPAMRMQTECCCNLIKKFNVVGVSRDTDNLFLSKHLSLHDPVDTIIQKLSTYRVNHHQEKCDLCLFLGKIKMDTRRFLHMLSVTEDYATAAEFLGVTDKFFRSKIYAFTQEHHIYNRRLFLWWLVYMLRQQSDFLETNWSIPNTS